MPFKFITAFESMLLHGTSRRLFLEIIILAGFPIAFIHDLQRIVKPVNSSICAPTGGDLGFSGHLKINALTRNIFKKDIRQSQGPERSSLHQRHQV